MLILFASIGLAAYAGIHLHVWQAARHLKQHVTERFASFDRERTEFLVEKMLFASKQAGQLCRMCSLCSRVVHRYSLTDGVAICNDCKRG